MPKFGTASKRSPAADPPAARALHTGGPTPHTTCGYGRTNAGDLVNYGRIKRGPMAADAFTQIRNALFRDPRLSFKDKGVFGLISTHRDGFGVSAEAIAACSTDGVSAVKGALRNLERYGYLRRTRQRNEDGTLGASVYFITDQPAAFDGDPEVETSRSAPAVENPPVDKPPVAEPPMVQPPVAEPTVANHPHKKTNSKNTSSKKTTSSPRPQQQPQMAPTAGEEGGSSQSSDINRAVLFLQMLPAPWSLGPKDARHIAPRLLAAVTSQGWTIGDQLAAELTQNPGGIRDYALVLEKDRIPNLRLHSVVHANRSVLPDWCGQCNRGEPPLTLAERTNETPDGRIARCPRCHPGAMPAAA